MVSAAPPHHSTTECLTKPYYRLLPLCGVTRSIKKEFRQLDAGFYGIGLPHPGVEATISGLNKLMMHYGCRSAVGMELLTSFEFFLLELGMSLQPFQVSYYLYSSLVTNCWLKSIWERVSKFSIEVTINHDVKLPRKGDKFLNQVLIEGGFHEDEMVQINRVRIHQQVLFVSDILSANG